jgi:hypothetical protein
MQDCDMIIYYRLKLREQELMNTPDDSYMYKIRPASFERTPQPTVEAVYYMQRLNKIENIP